MQTQSHRAALTSLAHGNMMEAVELAVYEAALGYLGSHEGRVDQARDMARHARRAEERWWYQDDLTGLWYRRVDR